jgi:hypothetical protein
MENPENPQDPQAKAENNVDSLRPKSGTATSSPKHLTRSQTNKVFATL